MKVKDTYKIRQDYCETRVDQLLDVEFLSNDQEQLLDKELGLSLQDVEHQFRIDQEFMSGG
jgi:hypothetical protein